jgi:hypothetical protein
VPTERKAIVDLLDGLSGRIFVAFEEGTQSQWLHDVIKPHSEQVVVCNLRGQSATTNKSDRLDADRPLGAVATGFAQGRCTTVPASSRR